jgi:hypothetical protein
LLTVALAALMAVVVVALTHVNKFIVVAPAVMGQFGLFGPVIPVRSHQLVQVTFN